MIVARFIPSHCSQSQVVHELWMFMLYVYVNHSFSCLHCGQSCTCSNAFTSGDESH